MNSPNRGGSRGWNRGGGPARRGHRGRSTDQGRGMDRSPRRGRGRGGFKGGEGGGGSKFVKVDTMVSAQRLMRLRREEAETAAFKQYLGVPPQNRMILEAQLVIPGKHLVPEGLDQTDLLDKIRAKHETWITNEKSHIFNLASYNMSGLQQALKALNWLIHDLRLSDDEHNHFLVQLPFFMSDRAAVSMVLGARPEVISAQRDKGNQDKKAVVQGILNDIGLDIPKVAESLMALGQDLRMSVNFGRLNLTMKKRTTPDQLPYPDFKKTLKQYALRGGAALGTMLPDVRMADPVIKALSNPPRGIRHAMDTVRMRDYLTMTFKDNYEVSAEIVGDQLMSATIRQPEDWPRLDWTVSAPDRRLDWNFRVWAMKEADMPQTLQKDLLSVFQCVSFKDQVAPDTQLSLKLPRPRFGKLQYLRDKFKEVRVKSSAIIPFNAEPYEVEVNVTQTWNGSVGDRIAPEVTWGIELYGISWEAAVNKTGPDGRKKDWGDGLINVWPGDEERLQARFGHFLHCVQKVQGVLDRVDPEAP